MVECSCESKRWEKRNLHAHFSWLIGNIGFDEQFDSFCSQQAEILAKQELGQLPERPPVSGLMVRVNGNEKSIDMFAMVDVGLSYTRLQPEMIETLSLEPSGNFHFEPDQDLGWKQISLYRCKLQFGEYTCDVQVLPTEMGIPCVVGGEFFQKALVSKTYILHEAISQDLYRTVLNVARCKKDHVFITGKYGAERERLVRIQSFIGKRGYKGVILDELNDIEEQSLPEKMIMLASIARFVICDDIAPSGAIDELRFFSEQRFTTAVLRRKGWASTAMQAHISLDVEYMRIFEYDSDAEFEKAISMAVEWGEQTVRRRSEQWNLLYSWRTPDNLLTW